MNLWSDFRFWSLVLLLLFRGVLLGILLEDFLLIQILDGVSPDPEPDAAEDEVVA